MFLAATDFAGQEIALGCFDTSSSRTTGRFQVVRMAD
jgi:hypothetical protein